ncbi:MAG: hypothetical protein ACREC5_00335, partial [Thermoplasmata archaeon]
KGTRAPVTVSRVPPSNGDELGRELLRTQPNYSIVLVTALDPEDPRVQRLRKAGAYDVIVKPVRASHIQEVLVRLNLRFDRRG